MSPPPSTRRRRKNSGRKEKVDGVANTPRDGATEHLNNTDDSDNKERSAPAA